jgi:hypothetical protein
MIEMQNYLLSPGEHLKGAPKAALLDDDADDLMLQVHPVDFLQLN